MLENIRQIRKSLRSHRGVIKMMGLNIILGGGALASLSPALAGETVRIELSSRSPIERAAVEKAFHQLFPDREILIREHPTDSQVAIQPVGQSSGLQGARNRLQCAREQIHGEPPQAAPEYWISAESFIDSWRGAEGAPEVWLDQAVVLVQKSDGPIISELFTLASFDTHYAAEAQTRTEPTYPRISTGFQASIAQIIEQKNKAETPELSADNWQQFPQFGGASRVDTLSNGIIRAVLKTEIKATPNFPSEGILFRDLSPLLAHPELRKATIQLMAKKFEGKSVDFIAGLDARGFILGVPLADELKKPFLMVRKKGKLPEPSFTETYDTEYSHGNELQISGTGFEGATILIVDDLLATGGTLRATENLFKKAGATTIYSTCLIELKDLRGRDQLSSDFYSLLQYD